MENPGSVASLVCKEEDVSAILSWAGPSIGHPCDRDVGRTKRKFALASACPAGEAPRRRTRRRERGRDDCAAGLRRERGGDDCAAGFHLRMGDHLLAS